MDRQAPSPPARASTRKKLAIAAITTALAALVAWQVWRTRAPRDTVTFTGDAEDVQRLLVERQTQATRSAARSAEDFWSEPLAREPIGKDDAQKLFTMPAQTFDYDPFTHYRYKPFLNSVEAWAEHEGGAFEKRTNSLGLREDNELAEGTEVLVVATGDSHVDGLCANSESFPNRLEAALRERHPGRSIEVLNTGVTGYSFYNYLGAIERFAERKPRAFVVAFYGGNDFLEVLKPWHWFNRTAPPPRTKGYWARIDAAKSVSNQAVAVAFNQLVYFQYYPDQQDVAVEAAIRASAEIVRVCTARGIRPFFVYIPPGFDVDGALEPDFARAKERLELSDADLQQYHRLADRLIAVLRAHGVDVLDLREEFVEDIDLYYWSDLHINAKGHQFIADRLLARIEQAVGLAR